MARLAPLDKAVDALQHALAPDAGRFLQHDLVKAQPDMIHAHAGDVVDVPFGDIGIEVLQVALRDRHAPLVGQHVESLVVGQPAADSHAALKAPDLLHRLLLLRCFFYIV